MLAATLVYPRIESWRVTHLAIRTPLYRTVTWVYWPLDVIIVLYDASLGMRLVPSVNGCAVHGSYMGPSTFLPDLRSVLSTGNEHKVSL